VSPVEARDAHEYRDHGPHVICQHVIYSVHVIDQGLDWLICVRDHVCYCGAWCNNCGSDLLAHRANYRKLILIERTSQIINIHHNNIINIFKLLYTGVSYLAIVSIAIILF
jgi:hypothetical protein